MTKEMLPEQWCNLSFPKTITRWDEAIPLGNGPSGALVWGSSRELRFSLDRGDIWDVTPYPGVNSPEFTYENMIRMAKEGDVEGIRRVFDAPYNQVLPTKLPAGKLIFDFKSEENVSSELNLAQAEAMIHIGKTELRSFLHAVENFGMMRVSCPPDRFDYRIENPEFGRLGEKDDENEEFNSVSTASLKRLHYPDPELHKQDDARWFVQKVNDTFAYGVFVREKQTPEGTELAYTVASSKDGEDWQTAALARLDRALNRGYEKTFAPHVRWWHAYWQQSGMTLPDPLFEKNWYLTNYLLASCSRKGSYPMPLQGVWTADNGALPPWKGDYHHDLNTQMCYYSFFKANHLPEGESFLDYLWSMKDKAHEFARSFYGTDGICLPSVMSLDGTALGGWGMYSLSPTNQIWLSQSFERYYRFTGDQEFLKQKAYPYLSQTAEFILSLLEEREGMLYLSISSSPEIHDDEIESFVTPNSNYDLALMRYLFSSLAQLAGELGSEEAERWEGILAKLPPLAVDNRNCLMVSPDEILTESHRHFSHAMSIHPLRLLSYDREEHRKIIDATVLDLEQLGTGFWVGFSFTWMAELYAIQRNGEGAAYQLETFWRNICSPNGFHLNGDYKRRGVSQFHYRPFTLEANFCAADALQEMLLQSENGVLRLFPAIPEAWQDVSFHSLRAERGMLVSAGLEKGKLKELTLNPKENGEIQVVFPENTEHISGVSGVEIAWQGNVAHMKLQGGKTYSFSF